MNKPLTNSQSSKIPSSTTHKTLKTLSLKPQNSQEHMEPQQVSTRVLDVLVPPVFESLIKKTPFVTFSPKNTTVTSVQKETCTNVHTEPVNIKTEPINIKTEPSSPVASRESTFKNFSNANNRKEVCQSPKNFRTEPSSPVESRDSTPDKSFHSSKSIQSNKSFHSSKSLGADKSGLQGILKRKEKSRFSFHSKKSKNKRQASAPRVIIIEGLYEFENSVKGGRNV